MSRRTPIRVTPAILRRRPLPSPDDAADKSERGRVLVVGGTRELVGAVRLAAEGALRAGAGKVQVATVRGTGIPLGVVLPEARVVELPAAADGTMRGAGAARRRAADADAVLVGPGMEDGPGTTRIVAGLAPSSRTLVLDAGAIAALGATGAARRIAEAGVRVITPHFGEMAALVGEDIDTVRADPVGVAASVASTHDCVVVLKSATTWIVAPDGDVWRHDDGPVALATSGSGDVLAGVLAGLLARGAPPVTASLWAVAMHAAAGRALTRRHGRVGLLARELPEAVAAAFARHGQSSTSSTS